MSGDFSDNSSVSTKAEMIVFVVDSNIYKKFDAALITEDKLVNSSDIYLNDNNTPTKFKKIKVVPE